MKLMKIFLFVILSYICAMPVLAEPTLNTYLAKDGNLLVSYKMQDNKDSAAFFEHITDSLKSGKEIQVVHQVALKQGKLFAITFAKTEESFSLSYDLLQSIYNYKQNSEHYFTSSADKNRVKKDILTIGTMPLLLKNKLVSGDEYRISVKIFTREAKAKKVKDTWKTWFGKLQFPSFTQKSITYEVSYIAR